MKKVAIVFMLAVFVPSLVLAWLAFRSLRDEQLVAERQQAMLCQGVVDAVAKEASGIIHEKQREFHQQVLALISDHEPREAALSFDQQLRRAWPLADVGFVVSLDGQVLAPSLFASPEARKFRLENDRFLCNRETVEVYWNSPKGSINLSKLDQKEGTKAEPVESSKETGDDGSKTIFATKSGKVGRAVTPSPADPAMEALQGKTSAEQAEFRQLIGDSSEGTIARFLQDKLKVFFWDRSPRDPRLVFGAQLHLPKLVESLKNSIRLETPFQKEWVLALLDETGRPVHVTEPGFSVDWKRPFVSAEVGEMLPHWEVAAYLLNPGRPGQIAQAARLTLGLLIALLVAAISVGSWLIAVDLKRQLLLARQKTDFVSNVSHELKTPLTSIRMFSEILAEGRVQEEDKRQHYLHIISAETARLTRLINNVLDFARIERGEKRYQFEPCNAATLVKETVEAYRPHLDAAGFSLQTTLPEIEPYIAADRDAIAQVIVNLLSNAEKYSGERKEIQVELRVLEEQMVVITIADRGLGVPPGCSEKIFEQFYRAHDSLASGIQGSGLGLTLARQIARAHQGDVQYAPREGGGSCFTLRLPLSRKESR
jgi:signal transduction histidine kinase